MPPRTSKALGVTPRMVTLVGVPSERRGMLPTTTISGEARGRPSAPVATLASTTILLRWSRGTQEVSSEAEPRWTTMAFSGSPVERRAHWKPVRIAMRATKTVTTRPIPITASRLTCQRARTLRTLYPRGSAMALDLPPHVDDPRAIGGQGGEEARRQAEDEGAPETLAGRRPVQPEARE